MGLPNLNIAAIGQAQAGALAAGNLALVIPAILGGKPNGYQPLPASNPDGTVQPQQPAFVFQYEGENKAVLESDITDHYIENNSAIQDMITLHPIIISVHGFMGELTDVPSGFSGTLNNIMQAAGAVTQKLSGVSAYAPALSIAATNIYNQANQAYQTANSVYNSGKAVVDSLKGVSQAQGKQAQAYTQFENWRNNRQLFNIQTPWRLYQNFAILSLTATQDERTTMVTDFFITFKQMNFTSVNVTTSLGNVPSILQIQPTTTALALAQQNLGSSLYNASSAQVSQAAPSSGVTPSVLPGSLASGTGFSLGGSQ